MPAAIAIPAIAAVVGAGVSAYGQHKASKAQGSAADKALAYQREQDTRAQSQADLDRKNQIAFAKFQWQSQAPLRAARRQVLAKYGIDAPDTPMPDFESMPAGLAAGAPSPGAQIPRSGGGGAGLATLGAGIGAAGIGLASALRGRNPYQTVNQPYSTMTAGAPGGPAGPPGFDPNDLSNWSKWSGYGIPDSEYQGE